MDNEDSGAKPGAGFNPLVRACVQVSDIYGDTSVMHQRSTSCTSKTGFQGCVRSMHHIFHSGFMSQILIIQFSADIVAFGQHSYISDLICLEVVGHFLHSLPVKSITFADSTIEVWNREFLPF